MKLCADGRGRDRDARRLAPSAAAAPARTRSNAGRSPRRRSGPARPAGRRSRRWAGGAAAGRAAGGPRGDRSRQPDRRPALRLGRRPPELDDARATTAPAPSATRCTAPACSTRTMVSGELAYWGEGGVGRWITVYANSHHVYMVVAGLRFDTRDGLTARTGPRWHTDMPRDPTPLLHRRATPPGCRSPTGQARQRPMWKPISSGTPATAGAEPAGLAAGELGLLLGDDPAADRFAAEPVEGLGRDAGRRGVDEGEARGFVAAVEGQRGERPADHVGGADAVAGVAGGGEGAAAAQRQDQRQVGRRGVDRPAPGVGDLLPRQPREEVAHVGDRLVDHLAVELGPARRARRPARSCRRPSRRRSGRPGWCGSSRPGRGCR